MIRALFSYGRAKVSLQKHLFISLLHCPGNYRMIAATMFVQDRPRCRWQRSLNIHYNLFLLFFFFFLLCQRIRLWLAGLQNIGNWNKISPFGIRYSVFNLRLWNRMKVLTLYRCVFKFLIIETFWCYIYQRLISYYRCLFNSLYILFTINENISNNMIKRNRKSYFQINVSSFDRLLIIVDGTSLKSSSRNYNSPKAKLLTKA